MNVSQDNSRGTSLAVELLLLYVAVLYATPSILTFTALGSLGRPATILGLGLFVWWLAHEWRGRGGQSAGLVRYALFAFVGSVLISYWYALAVAVPSTLLQAATGGALQVLSWAGVSLTAMDGVKQLRDLDRLGNWISVGGAMLAALGILQFLTGNSLIDWISLPGTGADTLSSSVAARSGFARASGTSMHPLEYGVILTIAFPLALVRATTAPTKLGLLRSVPVLVIGVAGLLSVSRSTLIGLVLATLLLLPSLPHRTRVRAIVGALVATAALGLMVPGLLRTSLNLFTGVGTDPSATSRWTGLGYAARFIANSPWIGKGLNTFQSSAYIFDDAYVLLAVEVGFLGLLTFLLLVGGSAASAWVAMARSTDSSLRATTCAIAAGLTAVLVLFAFFDGVAFPQSAGMLFVYVGMCGASFQLIKTSSQGAAMPAERAQGAQ